jgi:ring hydroxylating enzyme alpha subunit
MDRYEVVETMSLDGRSHAPNLLRLTEGQDRMVYYFQLFPNLLISLHPDYVMTHRLTAIAPGHTAVECEWLFSHEAVEQEGFDPHPTPATFGTSPTARTGTPARPFRGASISSSRWSPTAILRAKSPVPQAAL